MHTINKYKNKIMAQLSDRLNRLAPSATLAMSQKSSEMKAQGIDVINMSVGEPDFNTPDNIKQAAKKAIDENYSRYSPVPGYPDLRKAIVAKLKNENGLEYTTNEVIVGTGGKQCVCNAVLALVNPGDEVIIPAPYWVSYPQMVKLAGGVPVTVSAGFEQDFKMTAEQLENAITDKTKMLILCSPSNPTGSVYSKEELASLAEVLRKHFRESSRFLRAYVQSIGFRKTTIEYTAGERAGGRSKYSLRNLFKFSVKAMISYSDLPLKIASLCGTSAGIASVLLIIYSIYMKIHVGAPGGYTTIIVVICFMFTVLFFLLGIIGEYLSVILGEIRRRPIYLVRDTVNLEKEQEKENEYI